MSTHTKVKIEDLTKKANLSAKYVNKKLSHLDQIDAITAHRMDDTYSDVILNYMAYDALALNDLVKNNILQAIGKSIGVGKESNVFIGILDNGSNCALKFHKLGKTKFKSTKRTREYFAHKKHISRLYESTINAKREVVALKKLAGIVPVPMVYGYNRHLIVMELIEGVELQNVTNIDEKFYKIFYFELLEYIKLSLNLNIVHGDLSPFNILVEKFDENYKLTIIDWPQYLELDHPNALDTLLSDINNIYNFFRKKTEIEFIDVEKFGTQLFLNAKKSLHLDLKGIK
jgi:RIO kinase 2